MEKSLSVLRRRSGRLQNNDARAATTPNPPIQRQPRTSAPSEKRRMAPPRSAPKARPKRSKDQKTLTQIDFVTRSNPTPDLDLDLDYIEHEVPSPPRKSRNKGKGKKTKIDRNQSNTLTQMDYVARRPWDDNEEELGEDMAHVPGTDDEDDDDLERTGTPPRWEAVRNENNLGSAHSPSPERRAKRRRLESTAPVLPRPLRSEEIGISQTGREKENERHKSVPNPSQQSTSPAPSLHPASQRGTTLQVTPKKQQKWEIPSSQSPDSPGFIMLGNSPRSPLKTKSLNSPLAPVSRKPDQTPSSAKVAAWSSSHSKQHPKGVVPGSPITVGSQCTPQTLVTENETPGTSPMPAALREAQKEDCSRPQSPLGTKPTSQKPSGSGGVYTPKDINVPKTSIDHEVCETDAESEDEFHDSHPSLSEQGSRPHLTDLDDIHGEVDSGNTHSPPKSGFDSHPNPDEADTMPDHSTALTNASILYHRRPQDDPLDPTASELDVDSERLAELFPQNEQETLGSTLPAWPIPDSTPRQHSPTQNPADISTEFIPESSQRPVEGETHDIPKSSPPEVILIESSQPNDQPTQGERRSSDSGPRDIFTTSQLLPDSLMESIPGPPPEWVFSDDFIPE